MKNVLLVVLVVIVVGVVVGGAVVYQRKYDKSQATALDSTSSSSPSQSQQSSTQTQSVQTPAPGHIEITDETVGTGAEAVAGKTVTVNYVGTLTDGTKFDSSYDRNQPFQFSLGAGQVIQGWDQGVVGMKVGGKRKLVIPPDLAYGANPPTSAIPPNATLVFEIELLNVQ